MKAINNNNKNESLCKINIYIIKLFSINITIKSQDNNPHNIN